jgi:hypothetical protein
MLLPTLHPTFPLNFTTSPNPNQVVAHLLDTKAHGDVHILYVKRKYEIWALGKP